MQKILIDDLSPSLQVSVHESEWNIDQAISWCSGLYDNFLFHGERKEKRIVFHINMAIDNLKTIRSYLKSKRR